MSEKNAYLLPNLLHFIVVFVTRVIFEKRRNKTKSNEIISFWIVYSKCVNFKFSSKYLKIYKYNFISNHIFFCFQNNMIIRNILLHNVNTVKWSFLLLNKSTFFLLYIFATGTLCRLTEMHSLFKQNLVLCKELDVDDSLTTLFFEAKYLFF